MSFKEIKDQHDHHRQDWQQTSTGVGHHYRPGYYFPSSDFKTLIGEPVPPPLAKQDNITRDEMYKTTYGEKHDHKYGKGGPYDNTIHRKAPGHWKVNYIKDLAEKLDKGGWRRPLTVGNQKTETQAEFQNKAGVRQKYHFNDSAGLNLPQPYSLNDHHREGPSKYGQGTTQNPKLQGQPFYVRNKGVLNLLDPYLSTTQKDHRSFRPDELKKYPKKDVATYWECEEYPKAWGHGLKHNPIPKDNVPREPLPMVDPTWFKTRTKIPRQPKALLPVPHAGLKPLYMDSYNQPSDVKAKDNFFCPVDTPFTLPNPGSNSVFTAPKMYDTEYQHVGSNKPIIV